MSDQTVVGEHRMSTETFDAAKVLLAEKNIGSLEVGKSADMILLDRDILTVSPEAMRDTKVVWTMFEGRMVYKNSLNQNSQD